MLVFTHCNFDVLEMMFCWSRMYVFLGLAFFAGLNCSCQCQKVVYMKCNFKTYFLVKSCASISSTGVKTGAFT